MKDEKYVHMIHILAEKGRGSTSPNPLVGALVVKRERIIARGYHERFGGPHAEAVAISACGNRAKGATLYVSLEPCCHYGKTPPCTDLIIRSGIKRVVCSTLDPNPLVNGKGKRKLRKAGIKVDVGILEEEAKRLNEAYFKYITTRIPFATLKIVGTINGKMSSTRTNIKSVNADAIVIDVAEHNPLHFSPLPTGKRKIGATNPKIILLGKRDVISRYLKKLKSDNHLPIILVPTDASSRIVECNEKYKVWKIRERKNGELDLLQFLKKCGKEEITSLLVEGGARIQTLFIKQKLADKIWYEISPQVSVKGEELIGDLGIKKMSEAIVLKNCEWKRANNSLSVVGYPFFK